MESANHISINSLSNSGGTLTIGKPDGVVIGGARLINCGENKIDYASNDIMITYIPDPRDLLRIKILPPYDTDPEIVNYYKNLIENKKYSDDSGIDLICPKDITCPVDTVTFADLGISCELVWGKTRPKPKHVIMNPRYMAYTLEARSSIAKTPLMLTNSRGLIDSNYRGPITAAFRCFTDTRFDGDYTITKMTRLVQLVSFSGEPLDVEIANDLSSTDRGSAGFGSTGK